MPDIRYKGTNAPLPRRKQYVSADAAPVAVTRNPDRARRLLIEKHRRRIETLGVLTFTEKQKRFIYSKARVRLLLGSNRSGKTSMSLIDAALVCTGQHPVRKYPKGYKGRIYFVGMDAKSLGEVFYRKLRGWGEFWIIRDKETGKWRSYNSNVEPERKDEAQPAPPLIPSRMVPKKGEAFRNKRTKEIKKIFVRNDLGQEWELDFFTAEGDPPRGANIDAAYFSEEIANPDWYNEMRMRLLDRKGFLVWDAAQQDGSDALATLDERADREMGSADPFVWKDRWSMYDNPYIPAQEIEDAKRDLLSEDDVRVRIYGEAAVKKIRLFPEFTVATHTFKRSWLPDNVVPANWTRYMAFDPGYECACALFLAVPEPGFGVHPNLWLVYDEIYVRNMSVAEHVNLIAGKTLGQGFYAFVIDNQQAQKHDASGKMILHQYVAEMSKNKVRSEQTGTGFWSGFSDLRAGTELVRTALSRCANGMPRIMFLEDTCPNTVNEMRVLKRDKTRSKFKNTVWLDVPAKGQDSHGFDCLRYLAALDPAWHRPKAGINWAAKRWKQFLNRSRGERESVVLGPRRRSTREDRP